MSSDKSNAPRAHAVFSTFSVRRSRNALRRYDRNLALVPQGRDIERSGYTPACGRTKPAPNERVMLAGGGWPSGGATYSAQ